MKERRRENRLWCADMVKVEWSEGGNETRTVEAVLEDVSHLGACVQVEEPIPVGAAISISASCGKADCVSGCGVREARFSGCVSHCEFRDYGYFVGIRLSDETKWSSQVFEPQHLTNLAALADR